MVHLLLFWAQSWFSLLATQSVICGPAVLLLPGNSLNAASQPGPTDSVWTLPRFLKMRKYIKFREALL